MMLLHPEKALVPSLPSSLVNVIFEVSSPTPLELRAATLTLYGIPASAIEINAHEIYFEIMFVLPRFITVKFI